MQASFKTQRVSTPWCPRILQARDAIKDGRRARVVDAVAHKVAVTLKLQMLIASNSAQTGLHFGLNGFEAVWVDGQKEVFAARIGLGIGEETVIDAHFSAQGVHLAHPSDHALDLDGIGPRCAAFGVCNDFCQDFSHLTFFVGDTPLALNHVAVLQTNLVAGEKPKKAFRWCLCEIGFFDPQMLRE